MTVYRANYGDALYGQDTYGLSGSVIDAAASIAAPPYFLHRLGRLVGLSARWGAVWFLLLVRPRRLDTNKIRSLPHFSVGTIVYILLLVASRWHTTLISNNFKQI